MRTRLYSLDELNDIPGTTVFTRSAAARPITCTSSACR